MKHIIFTFVTSISGRDNTTQTNMLSKCELYLSESIIYEESHLVNKYLLFILQLSVQGFQPLIHHSTPNP